MAHTRTHTYIEELLEEQRQANYPHSRFYHSCVERNLPIAHTYPAHRNGSGYARIVRYRKAFTSDLVCDFHHPLCCLDRFLIILLSRKYKRVTGRSCFVQQNHSYDKIEVHSFFIPAHFGVK